MNLPHIIALCGNPGAGKSQFQSILMERYGVVAVNDGEPLRDFAVRWMKLQPEDVYTQEGKARHTHILDKTWQNRKILGDLGKALESTFGADIMPFMATRALETTRSYCFDGVRRGQGHFYRALGGVVIEVKRSSAGPSPYDFDQFDQTAVDLRVWNDGSISDLEKAIERALQFGVPQLVGANRPIRTAA